MVMSNTNSIFETLEVAPLVLSRNALSRKVGAPQ